MVSVVVPVYNRADTLARTLDAICAQSLRPSEIIVVDDGSSDSSSEVAKCYDEVLLLRQTNMGVSAARNNGVMMASSRYIAFCDSDDVWHRDKLKKQIALHQNEPALAVSFTNEQWVRHAQKVNKPARFRIDKATLYKRSLHACILACSTCMIERDFFTTLGGFDEALEVCEDYDLWLRIMKMVPMQNIGYIDEMLTEKHAGHANQLSKRHESMERFRVKALEALHDAYADDVQITAELVQKYQRLYQGACKRELHEAAFHYKQRMDYFSAL